MQVDYNSTNKNLSIKKKRKRYRRMPNYIYDYEPNILVAKYMTTNIGVDSYLTCQSVLV